MHTNHATLGTDGQVTPPGDRAYWSLHDDHRFASPDAGGKGPSKHGLGEAAAADDVSRLEQEINGLRRRLLTQPVIEQAKGLLAGSYGIDTDTAFAVLVRWSQHTNTKLHLLAAGLVAAASNSGGQPNPGLQRFVNELPLPGRTCPSSRAEQ